MLDGECHNTKTVWGFPVPIRDSGRKIWSDELRAMAARKIEAGAGIRETAEEIGANKSLVAHWVKCAGACRRRRSRIRRGPATIHGGDPEAKDCHRYPSQLRYCYLQDQHR